MGDAYFITECKIHAPQTAAGKKCRLKGLPVPRRTWRGSRSGDARTCCCSAAVYRSMSRMSPQLETALHTTLHRPRAVSRWLQMQGETHCKAVLHIQTCALHMTGSGQPPRVGPPAPRKLPNIQPLLWKAPLSRQQLLDRQQRAAHVCKVAALRSLADGQMLLQCLRALHRWRKGRQQRNRGGQEDRYTKRANKKATLQVWPGVTH